MSDSSRPNPTEDPDQRKPAEGHGAHQDSAPEHDSAPEEPRAMNLLDVLGELLHLPPERRAARVAEIGLSASERAEVEGWLRDQVGSGAGLLGAGAPEVIRGAIGLLGGRPDARADAPDAKALDAAAGLLAPTVASASAKAVEGPGTRIGRYKLLERIGEGGFGVVFMAEQQHPVRRTVALKVLKPGMDTKQVVARFEAERQALALMEHPNIAKVLDAGATESGRPYVVMELVRGVPVTEYCDGARLSAEQRLKLFVQVCRAVQHAHSKGVIHRDLKPSNVLVTLGDHGEPIPKIIDFGIAKATQSRLTDRTLFTEFRQLLGTPLYMSPEQAEMSALLNVDTRSDVYALGVLLYELLTGTTPFERERLAKAAYDEVRRIIREEDPPRPSTRLSTLAADSLTEVSARRQTEPRQLGQIVRGELDWIVMRCLEKDRGRRYETADGLARDVERYLNDEAVEACPPSRLYRLKKAVRRNKGPVAAAAVVLLALLGGTVGTAVGLVRAEQARRAEAERARGERLAKQEAQAREAEAKAVLEFVEHKVFAAVRPVGHEGGLGHDVTLRRAIDAAVPFLDTDFAHQPLVEASLRLTVGKSFWIMGDAKAAAEQAQRAHKLYTQSLGPDHPDTLRSVSNIAMCLADLRRLQEALELQETTLALSKAKLGHDHPVTLQSMHNLSTTYSTMGRDDEAFRLDEQVLAARKAKLGPEHPETLQSMSHLATGYQHLGRYAKAVELHEATLALQKAKLGPEHSETLQSMHALAECYRQLGRGADAVRFHEVVLEARAETLGPDHPDTLHSKLSLATTYDRLGRTTDAVGLHEETLRLMKEKLGPDHPYTVASIHNLGACYQDAGRHADAADLYEQALALWKARLGPDHRHTLACVENLANTYAALGRTADALRLRAELLALQRAKLGQTHSDTLATANRLAAGLMQDNRGAEAVALIDEFIRHGEEDEVGADSLTDLVHLRFEYFRENRNAAGCRATAEMWERLRPVSKGDLYDAACLWAATAAVRRAAGGPGDAACDAEAEAERAMRWLGRAVAAGYGDVAHMAWDEELDALRGREDFRKLVPAPSVPSPFRGRPAALPGVVQAEDFDEGGLLTAYLDSSSEDGGAQAATPGYRPGEAVDIDDCSDARGGFNVGGIKAGEWLAYTVDVKEAGTYDLDVRLSAWSGGGRLHVEFGGRDASGPVDVPHTGGWNNWATVTMKGVRLEAGRQVMRVVFDQAPGNAGGGLYVCNINWVELRAAAR